MPPKAKEPHRQENSLNPTLQTAPCSLAPAPRPPSHCPQQGRQPASLLGGSEDPPKPHVHRTGVPKALAIDGRRHQMSCPSLRGHHSKAQQHSRPKLESQRPDPVPARRPSCTAAHRGDDVCNLKRDRHQGHQVQRKGEDQCAGPPTAAGHGTPEQRGSPGAADNFGRADRCTCLGTLNRRGQGGAHMRKNFLPEQTRLQERHTKGPEASGKVVNITAPDGNADQPHTHFTPAGALISNQTRRTQKIASVEEAEIGTLCVAGNNVRWCSRGGKQCGSSSKN